MLTQEKPVVSDHERLKTDWGAEVSQNIYLSYLYKNVEKLDELIEYLTKLTSQEKDSYRKGKFYREARWLMEKRGVILDKVEQLKSAAREKAVGASL